ncbi:MAG: histidine kinase, partial [Flavitalea sp.]
DNNNFGWINYKEGLGFIFPPFNFPGGQKINISKIWIDRDGDLFVSAEDSIYIIKEATKIFNNTKSTGAQKEILPYQVGFDKDSNMIVTEGGKKIERYTLGKGVKAHCFGQNASDPEIYIGTNHGLFTFDKKAGLSFNLFSKYKEQPVTITDMDFGRHSFYAYFWFSTMQNGMGSYSTFSKAVSYYPYKQNFSQSNPIVHFTRLSAKELLVAPNDSFPAIFNTETNSYQFIVDTSLTGANKTTDVKTATGNIISVIKDGELFISRDFLTSMNMQTTAYPQEPYIKEIVIQGISYHEKSNFVGRYDSLKRIRLKYHENKIDIFFAARGFSSSDTIAFAWKLDGYWDDWKEVPFSILDERMNMAFFDPLPPGEYFFRLKVKKGSGRWLEKQVSLKIIIDPPFWQTWWFWTAIIVVMSTLIFTIVKWRVRAARKHEREKLKHEKELLEMEARALRAQMNPHFIFNCLNSIKALIQNNEQQRSIDYLTTFSKLIRTLFQNSDKRQISLYDEIETCKLYTQLEAMRLNNKFRYRFDIDSNIDLKSVMVPALIIQPFIENAIWHGIVPKDEGNITVRIYGNNEVVTCEVDDNGIGRALSRQNKPVTPVMHDSKGIHLSQARLNLEKLLNDKNASISIIDKYENEIST